MTTRERIIVAAASLLDAGGEAAVTLRGVGDAAGLSHNAPYKHFKNRDSLLAAVVEADLAILTSCFAAMRAARIEPDEMLRQAVGRLAQFGRERPARYQLIFSASTLARNHPQLQAQTAACLGEIVSMVELSQKNPKLANVPARSLASLVLAAMHGLVTMEAIGLLDPEKGLPTVEDNVLLLISLLAR